MRKMRLLDDYRDTDNVDSTGNANCALSGSLISGRYWKIFQEDFGINPRNAPRFPRCPLLALWENRYPGLWHVQISVTSICRFGIPVCRRSIRLASHKSRKYLPASLPGSNNWPAPSHLRKLSLTYPATSSPTS